MRGLGLAVMLALTGCAAWRTVPLPSDAEVKQIETDDGWHLTVTRYRPSGPPTGRPVLVCHGISANARNMDVDEHHSVARYLASQGREAWTVSLRATGDSEVAQGRTVTFDDYWRHDLPSVIRAMQQSTGAPTVDFVAHSMGGMVLYAYLSQGGEGIGAAATLGSPIRLDWGMRVERLVGMVPMVVRPDAAFPTEGIGAIAVPFQGLMEDDAAQRLFYNPKSTTAQTWRRQLAYGTSNIAGGVILQLMSLMKGGRFTSVDGSIDFRQDMARITTPVLVVAARLDRVAPSPGVKDGFRALGGPKEWLLITRANGSHAEYGHMDLVLGERAADEVWSKVLDFLNRHAPKEP